MSVVICKLPDAGLGNQLFPLTKAIVFSHINNLPIIVTGYNRIKIGPYLRGEKNKRRYNRIFTFEKRIIGELFDKIKAIWYCKQYQIVHEPSLDIFEDRSKKVFLFDSLSHYSNYFGVLKPHRDLAIELFKKYINPNVLFALNKLTVPEISVHVRMGDFRKLNTTEDFANVGSVRTPLPYFKQMIESIRSISGKELLVNIFTDGFKNELKPLLDIKSVSMVEGNTDIVDLLLMSRSKIIVTSAGSTFSYWSAFLSDAIIIMHPDHIYESIRPKSIKEEYYEGPLNISDSILVKNLREIL